MVQAGEGVNHICQLSLSSIRQTLELETEVSLQ